MTYPGVGVTVFCHRVHIAHKTWGFHGSLGSRVRLPLPSWIWKFLTRQNQNFYLNTIEHYHNFSRTRLASLLNECGFNVIKYGVSERYRSGMEIVAQKII